ncbi:MAG: 2-oxoacid:acceptor oxidoreductase family protein [Chloroflexi bacterium]|nr:2-oxoacid:acceptor oxidoreductase family protein [Chloroflexota bacterium]
MLEEILIAGFGGQGVIFAGKLLCEAALADGKHVACSVSYGPEMRGGTANTSVIVSDDPIGSLVVSRPTVVIVMNEPSMAKFEPVVRSGGLLIVNETLVPRKAQRTDIKAIYVPATELAAQMGNRAVANLVLIGALTAVRPVASRAAVRSALERMVGKERPEMLGINQKALATGAGRVEDMHLAASR